MFFLVLLSCTLVCARVTTGGPNLGRAPNRGWFRVSRATRTLFSDTRQRVMLKAIPSLQEVRERQLIAGYCTSLAGQDQLFYLVSRFYARLEILPLKVSNSVFMSTQLFFCRRWIFPIRVGFVGKNFQIQNHQPVRLIQRHTDIYMLMFKSMIIMHKTSQAPIQWIRSKSVASSFKHDETIPSPSPKSWSVRRYGVHTIPYTQLKKLR